MTGKPETADSQTAARIALIKAHTLNELAHKPESVTAHDRLFLVGEVERLRKKTSIRAEAEAGFRLATGFMRCVQTNNHCKVTGKECAEKCGCREEILEWCKNE